MEFPEGLSVEEYAALDDDLETCEAASQVSPSDDAVCHKESESEETGFYTSIEEDDGGSLESELPYHQK